jgi:hypothetical protein
VQQATTPLPYIFPGSQHIFTAGRPADDDGLLTSPLLRRLRPPSSPLSMRRRWPPLHSCSAVGSVGLLQLRAWGRPCVAPKGWAIPSWPGTKRHDNPGLGPLPQPVGGHDMAQWELGRAGPARSLAGHPGPGLGPAWAA